MFPASLGISALLHLIALFVLHFESELVPGFAPSDPVALGPPVGMVVYDIEPQLSWGDIQAQRGATEIQEDIKDRIKAIRERREAERRDSTRRGGG